MSYTSNPAGQTTEPAPAFDLKLVRGILIAVLAALILMPVHWLFVASGYHDGYYTDYPELIAAFALLIAFAVRLGSGTRGPMVAVAGVVLTLFYLIGSEYFVARFLINQILVEQGYGELPLIVPLLTGFKMLGAYIANDPVQLIIWVIPVIAAGFIGMVANLGGRTGYRVSGGGPVLMAQQRPQAAAQNAASVRMNDVPSGAYALGQPVQAYYTRTMGLSIAGGLLILAGLGLGGFLFSARLPLLMALIFGLPFIGAGIYRLALAVIHMNNQVLIFKDGLSVEQGGKTAVLHWADITAVWMDQYRFRVNGIPVIDRHKYTLDTRTGGQVVLDKTYKNIGDLGALIENAVAKNLFSAAVTALNRGEGLVYGRFTLRKESLGVDNQTYPWQSTEITLNSGFVRVHLPGKSRAFDKLYSVSKIPNLSLFLTLVSMLASGKLPAAPEPAAAAAQA